MKWMRTSARRHADDAGRERAARELAHSEWLLQKAQQEVFLPLRRMREQDNVTELVRQLIRGGGRTDERGASSG